MKKGCVLSMLFDSIPIENYFYSLLHAEIDRVIKSPNLSFHFCLRLPQHTFDDTIGNVTLSIVVIIWCLLRHSIKMKHHVVHENT